MCSIVSIYCYVRINRCHWTWRRDRLHSWSTQFPIHFVWVCVGACVRVCNYRSVCCRSRQSKGMCVCRRCCSRLEPWNHSVAYLKSTDLSDSRSLKGRTSRLNTTCLTAFQTFTYKHAIQRCLLHVHVIRRSLHRATMRYHACLLRAIVYIL